MMFVGHFSFAGDNREACHALFKRLIRSAAKRGDVFDGASEIYMDSCIELRSVPSGGLMTYITIREGEDIGGISASLPGVAARSAVAYSWGRSADEDAAEPRPIEPFLRLRGKRAKAKPAEELPSRCVSIAFGPFPARPNQRANVIVRDDTGNLIQFLGQRSSSRMVTP